MGTSDFIMLPLMEVSVKSGEGQFLLLAVAYLLVLRSPLLPPAFNLAGMLLPLVGYVLVTRSAIRLARDVRQSYSIKSFNRWYVYLAVGVMGVSTLSFLLDAGKELVVKAYKIPAGSMIPTLLIGDHIYVDNLIYRLGTPPERGDIIVFKFPEDETKDFIKRIVAIPGDVIEIRNKQVIINGALFDDHGYTQRIDPGIIDGSLNPRDNFGPVTVPKNAYFVLGDNRDQSLDSRIWGYVDASKVRGKATFVYWSWSAMGKWYEWVRWERISQGIHSIASDRIHSKISWLGLVGDVSAGAISVSN